MNYQTLSIMSHSFFEVFTKTKAMMLKTIALNLINFDEDDSKICRIMLHSLFLYADCTNYKNYT